MAALSVTAQAPGTIGGTLLDSSSKQPLGEATISLLKVADSSLLQFTRSNASGMFRLKGIPAGRYRLLITHVSYQNFNLPINLDDAVSGLSLGTIYLTRFSSVLKEVTVQQERAPVTVKNDTIEYNAGSFRTRPNAVVEDLLKRLPGVQVEKDGTIKANGETVKKVLVDGKEFFGNDTKTATKNLPAEIVDKVQVFDRKSEQSQFTGFDDGNSEKTINLSLKPDKKNGLFGKAVAGAGTRDRYEGNISLNSFSGKQQFSLLGMANNTNKQGFSFMDILQFSGGLPSQGKSGGGGISLDQTSSGLPIESANSNSGIQSTQAGGINFNDTWRNRTDISGNYFFSRIDQQLDQDSRQLWFLPGNINYITNRQSISGKLSENHRLNLVADHRVDTANSLRYSSSFNYQEGSYASRSNYESIDHNNSLMNNGHSESYQVGDGINWTNNLLYRHKFRKKGRTIAASFSANYSRVSSETRQVSENRYYENEAAPERTDSIMQQSRLENPTTVWGGTVSYTEPLSKKALLEFNYATGATNAHSDKRTYEFDPLTGKFSQLNDALTNAFSYEYNYHRAGANVRFQDAAWQLSGGLMIQQSNLWKNFRNLLPNAVLQYNFNKFRNIRFLYHSQVQAPSIIQLQPVQDNSDPLNITRGNPSLRPEQRHAVRLHYMSFDPYRHTHLFVSGNSTLYGNRIVNADVIDSGGKRLTIPVNGSGTWAANGNLNWGFAVKKLKSSISTTTSAGAAFNVGYVNGATNRIKTANFSQEIAWNFSYQELLDIHATASAGYYDARYSLEPNRNNYYWQYVYDLQTDLYLPVGFSVSAELNYTRRTGLSPGYNAAPVIVNAGLAKQLFRNKKGELKLQLFDVLKQQVGIQRNSNQNYIEDITYTTLQQYGLISFTYNLSRFAGKSVPLPAGKMAAPHFITNGF